ncbi:MAG TPA: N-acetylmuramoyl-L-alanine amidase [Acidimicrobiales bacterium]
MMGTMRHVSSAALLTGAVLVTALLTSPVADHSVPDHSVPDHSVQADHGASTTSLPLSDAPIVDVAADAATGGYWLVASNGAVFGVNAPDLGSAGNLALTSPVVGMAATPDDGGYWLTASDGGVFAYGDARFAGSMGAVHLTRPVVGMAADRATGGYWLVASDGGVFTFDAPFEGSAGNLALTSPVVGMAATADGGGYWLVASDGGVFAYGDARFAGSMGAVHLTRLVVGMAAHPGGGYWLVGADGGIFSFGAPYEGSTGALVLDRGVVGMAATPDGGGYWMVGADGGVYALGDARYQGSVSVLPLAGLTAVIDPGHDGGNGADPSFIDRPIDGGGFTEPCDTTGTETDNGYTEHAFNFDVALRAQALLEADGARVVLTRSTDTGVGPCVNVRAAIADALHADVAVSIHADGGPPGGSGFAVDTPVPVVSSISDNRAIIGPSDQLSVDLRNAFASATGEPPSNYTGQNGIVDRGDLGGLDLSTVPKVLIECANMRNAADAAAVQSPAWRQSAAQGIADGLEAFLEAAQRT